MALTFVVMTASMAAGPDGPLPTGRLAPTIIPQPPRPHWDWRRIPRSFHGAVKDRLYTADEIAHLAKFQVVATEKWYTPCASAGPTQSGPDCAVEDKIEGLHRQLKAQANLTTVMYWNTLLDFSFYKAHAQMEAFEAQGMQSYLRDKNGVITSVCNDGDVYCNMTTYDWTKPWVREFWIDTVINFTKTGVVDGIFADHSGKWGNGLDIGADKKGQGPNQYCNGGHFCYNFTTNFTESFNSWHDWVTNYTQDVLSKTTGGPVIQGALAAMSGPDPCNFDKMRAAFDNTSRIMLEARNCQPDSNCLAAYLAAVEPYVYLHCLYNGDDVITASSFPEMDYELGAPHGPAVEVPAPGSNVWRRTFGNGVVVTYDNRHKNGSIDWPDHPPPPPPPSIECGPDVHHATTSSFLANHTFGHDDVAAAHSTASAQACCTMCVETPGCTQWAWHFDDATQPGVKCHVHGKSSTLGVKVGVIAGVLQK